MIKLASFRLRLALLSTTLAGTALIGFGIISWLKIYQTKVSRLDSEIKTQLWRFASPSPKNWELDEKSLTTFLTGISSNDVALMILDPHGNPVYFSNKFPTNLDLNKLLSQVVITNKIFNKFYQLKIESNQLINHHKLLIQEIIPNFPPPRRLNPEELNQLTKISSQKSQGKSWRIGLVKTPEITVIIAVNLKEINREMTAISDIFFVSIPLILILIGLASWGLSVSALTTINQITQTIKNVTAKGLDQRISLNNTDLEFRELLEVFNQMMERLERSFKQASRFSADAAHELKTPLAILQGVLERTIQQAEAGSQMQENLINLLDEVRRLSSITRKLLLLSLADAGQMKINPITVNFSELLIELAEDIEILAPDLTVKLEIKPNLMINADRDLLIQVLHNLITNAIKYNLPSGWIKIKAENQNNHVIMRISNSSKNISPNTRKQIFDRFYREDSSHNRQIEGLGLGLSLAREIIRAHGGDLTLDPPIANQTDFTLILKN